MIRTRSIPLLAALAAVALVALVVAGCGDNNDDGDATAASPPPKTKSGGSATVGVANSSLGNILVDSQGRTIYLFQQDTGTKSTCSGACATEWPPVRVSGKPTAGSGVNSLDARNHPAVRREAAGHLQRPPALPVRGRQQRR